MKDALLRIRNRKGFYYAFVELEPEGERLSVTDSDREQAVTLLKLEATKKGIRALSAREWAVKQAIEDYKKGCEMGICDEKWLFPSGLNGLAA